MTFEQNELYQEIKIMMDGVQIGEAEIELNDKMLARFVIFEPYQNKGYGKQVIKMFIEKYGINKLWVRTDNERAIHVYESCGFKITKPTMYMMEYQEKQ